MSKITKFDYKNHWQEQEIILKRSNNNHQTLGFVIAGGTDTPYFDHPHFTYIIIVDIIENSIAYNDKRLKLYDLILRVNNIDFTNITHQTAIDALKTAGRTVRLLIRRLSPPIIEQIELEHHENLGILITGGIGNEYYPNEYGIFVMDIDQHQTNKGLEIGDRLLQISSDKNIYDLKFVTHQYAIKFIQSACAESRKIKLYVGHTKPTTQVQSARTILHQGQNDSHKPKNEDSATKNRDNKTEHYLKNGELKNTMRNKRYGNNKSEANLIMKFDYDDYLRYENRERPFNNLLLHNRSTKSSEALLGQAHNKKFTIAPPAIDHDTMSNSDRNPVNNERVAHEPKLKEGTICDVNAEKLEHQKHKIVLKTRINRDGASIDENGGFRWQLEYITI